MGVIRSAFVEDAHRAKGLRRAGGDERKRGQCLCWASHGSVLLRGGRRPGSGTRPEPVPPWGDTVRGTHHVQGLELCDGDRRRKHTAGAQRGLKGAREGVSGALSGRGTAGTEAPGQPPGRTGQKRVETEWVGAGLRRPEGAIGQRRGVNTLQGQGWEPTTLQGAARVQDCGLALGCVER